jgi:hypothetical protein
MITKPDHYEWFSSNVVNIYSWGEMRTDLQKYGNTTITLRGFRYDHWPDKTLFIDYDYETLALITETSIDNAPIVYHLKTLKNTDPGEYSVDLVFTYYNGKEWKSSRKTLNFTVKSRFQRAEPYINYSLVIIGFISIVPVIYLIYEKTIKSKNGKKFLLIIGFILLLAFTFWYAYIHR